LSSDDDDDTTHPPEHDTPTERKVSVVDDDEGTGTTLVEALVPGLIGAGAPGVIRPPSIDQVPTIHLYHRQAHATKNACVMP
jgi:hypothetical protein